VKVYHGLGIDLCRGYGTSYAPGQEGERHQDGKVERLVSGQTCWEVRHHLQSYQDLREWQGEPTSWSWLREHWVPEVGRVAEAFQPHTMYVPGCGIGFHAAYGMMGLELFCYALGDEPAHVERMLETLNENAVRMATVAAEAKLCPLFFLGDDIAYKGRLMFSPAFLRRTFVPMLARVCAPLRAAGIKVIFHSDGNVTELVDDMLEAGIDGLNPIEPMAGMDIGALKRRYRGRLILVGNVDCSQVLPLGTPEQVVEATREVLRVAGPGGGLFIGSSSEVTPSTPLENVLALYRTVHEEGRYPLRG
jgi:uroporphyrinogen-III decarboxylase